MRTDLWQLIVDISGISNVVWANGLQEFTGRPLITLQIINSQNNNMAIGDVDATGVAQIHKDTLLTLRVQYFDSSSPYSAFEAASLLMAKLDGLTSVHQSLRSIGLAYVQTLQNVQDVPALAGVNWESRAVFDIQLRALTSLSDTIGLIESVEIQGTIDGNINVNINQEV